MGLQAIVTQYQFFDILRHVVQHPVAFGGGDLACVHFHIQPDFGIHFMIGAINPGGVVDGVGKDATARQRKLNPPGLGCTQITAFCHHFAA